MFAEILPLRKMPKGLDYFDYLVPLSLEDKIRLGQMVTIPFRKQNIKGLVFRLKKTTDFKNIKEISGIVGAEPLLTPTQIKLAIFTADYYVTSLPTVLKQIVPPILKRPRPGKIIKPFLNIKTKIPPEINSLAEKLRLSRKKFLFYYQNPAHRIAFYLKLIGDFLKKGKQVLIVFPEIIDIDHFLKFLPENIALKTAVVHHRLAASLIARNYNLIKNGETFLILGTPLSVFLPFKNLGLIIIDQEENQNHKQYDQNPRFNSKRVAEELIKLSAAKLIFSAVCPNIETYYRTIKDDFLLLKAPDQLKSAAIIDLRKQPAGTVLSAELKTAIKNTLSQGKKIFLFLNRRGFSRALTCLDCGRAINCPHCQVPFIIHQEKSRSFLLCHRCGRRQENLLTCPHCQGPNLKLTGAGLEKVESELINIFPQAKVGRFEGKLPTSFSFENVDIIIGTHLIFKYLPWEKIKLIGVIAADNILNIPDFRAQEKTYQLLTRILSQAELGKKSELIIQTYCPDNPALKFFPGRFESFFREELKNRKEFNYPPFTKIIKITAQASSPQVSEKEGQYIYHKIRDLSPFSLSPPVPAFIFERFGNYRYNLVLKCPLSPKSDKIRNFLKTIPGHFIIDVEPENLL